MNCPSCSNSLSSGRVLGCFLLVCPNCHGVGADRTFTRKTFGKTFRTWYKNHAAKSASSHKPCPFCRKDLFRFDSEDHKNCAEICKSCRLTWVDSTTNNLPQSPPKLTMAAQLVKQTLEKIIATKDMAAELPAISIWHKLYAFLKWIPAGLGLPVEEEEMPTKTKPVLTAVLFFSTIVATLVSFTALSKFFSLFALYPNHPWDLGGVTFITNIFLHENYMHLFGNIYFLVIFGDNVEDYLKRGRYLLLFLLSGIVGGIAHCIWDVRPLVGASGAVAGIITFYALQFPKAKLGRTFFSKFLVLQFPAWVGLILWLGLQTTILFQQLDRATGTSALAHFGGVLIGIIFRIIFR